MLVVPERQDINHEFELVHARLHPCRHIVLRLNIAELLEHLLIFLEPGGVEVNTIFCKPVVNYADLINKVAYTTAARLDIEVGIDGEARHIVVAGTDTYIIAHRHSHIYADAHSPYVDAHIHVIKDVLILHHGCLVLCKHACRKCQH